MQTERSVTSINEIVLYSTGCPRCTVLKKKLAERGIAFEEENSVDKMIGLGITTVPVLKVNGRLLDFTAAVKWVNEQ